MTKKELSIIIPLIGSIQHFINVTKQYLKDYDLKGLNSDIALIEQELQNVKKLLRK